MSTDIVRVHPATPATLPEKMQYAQALAASGMLPAQYRRQPANLLWALEFSESLGLHPMTAITGVHVIEGKPSASAGLISALVRRAGHTLRVRGDDSRAVAQIVRTDDPDFTFECVWTLDRAVQAGLCKIQDGRPYARSKKGEPLPWERFPASMLKARAITEVAREACEEALSGVKYTPEELGAVVDSEGNPVAAPVQPLRPVVEHQAVSEPEVNEQAQEIAEAAAKATHRGEWRPQWAAATGTGLAEALVRAPDTGEIDELCAYLTRLGTILPEDGQEPQQRRNFVLEAQRAASADEVWGILRDATDAGLDEKSLGHITAVGNSLTGGETGPQRRPVEAGATTSVEDAVAAEKALRELGEAIGLPDIGADFERAKGLSLSEATAEQIRAFHAELNGTAA